MGLLVEQQSTNLLTYSSDYTNAAWSKNGVSAITAASVAPDGTQTAQFLQETTANTSWHFWSQSSGVITTSTAYTLSAYFKNNGTQYAYLQFAMGGTTAQVVMDTTTGLITYNTGSSGTVTSVGNGWYKLSITSTTSSNTGGIVYVGISRTSPTVTQYTGDGYRGMYVWGAQLEATAFPTSYIPTVATTMTRIIDSAVMTGTNFSSWFNQGQYTMYAEGYSSCPSPNASSMALFCVNGAITQNSSNLGHVGTSPVSNFYNSGVLQGNFTGTGTWNLATNNKIALAINTNDSSGAINGVVASSITSNLIPSGLNYLYIGSYSAQTFNGTIKRILCYPARLTNTQIQALTTI